MTLESAGEQTAVACMLVELVETAVVLVLAVQLLVAVQTMSASLGMATLPAELCLAWFVAAAVAVLAVMVAAANVTPRSLSFEQRWSRQLSFLALAVSLLMAEAGLLHCPHPSLHLTFSPAIISPQTDNVHQ